MSIATEAFFIRTYSLLLTHAMCALFCACQAYASISLKKSSSPGRSVYAYILLTIFRVAPHARRLSSLLARCLANHKLRALFKALRYDASSALTLPICSHGMCVVVSLFVGAADVWRSLPQLVRAAARRFSARLRTSSHSSLIFCLPTRLMFEACLG